MLVNFCGMLRIDVSRRMQGSLHYGAKSAPPVEMTMLKGEGLGEVGFEAVEVGAQDVRLGKVVDELTFFFGADQAGGFKLFHEVREGGGGYVDAVAHAATGGAGALGADLLEDLVAARVGESTGDEGELVFG